MKFSDLNLLDVGNATQLAGAIYIGNGKMYLAMFPDEAGCIETEVVAGAHISLDTYKNSFLDLKTNATAEVQVLNMNQEEWEAFIRQTDLLETQGLVKAANGTVEKAILRKSQRQIEQGVSWKVFRRDSYACRYCRASEVPLTVDHLVCWEEGGPSIEANLVTSCRRCNKTRGNISYSDWLEHTFYKKVSANLTEVEREANRRLVDTLDSIPRHYSKRSR